MSTENPVIPEEGVQAQPAPSFEERVEQRLTNVTDLVNELIDRLDVATGQARSSVTKTVTEETSAAVEASDDKGALGAVFDEQTAGTGVVEAQAATTKTVTRTVTPVGIEREVFGMWSVMLRNAGGIAAAMTTCIIALVNAYTTYMSVTAGTGWPSETTLFITNIGPIVVAWTFMNSSKTISTIMQVRGVQDRLKNAMSGFVANPEESRNRRATDQRPETPPVAPPAGPVPPQY
jgi:hypothetical protein